MKECSRDKELSKPRLAVTPLEIDKEKEMLIREREGERWNKEIEGERGLLCVKNKTIMAHALTLCEREK